MRDKVDRCWYGAEFLTGGDGYRTVIASLTHYTKRLRDIENSPEMRNAGTFAMIIRQAAIKRYPQVLDTAKRLREFLDKTENAHILIPRVDVMILALECYKADIERAQQGSEYYRRLVGEQSLEQVRIQNILDARRAINRFE